MKQSYALLIIYLIFLAIFVVSTLGYRPLQPKLRDKRFLKKVQNSYKVRTKTERFKYDKSLLEERRRISYLKTTLPVRRTLSPSIITDASIETILSLYIRRRVYRRQASNWSISQKKSNSDNLRDLNSGKWIFYKDVLFKDPMISQLIVQLHQSNESTNVLQQLKDRLKGNLCGAEGDVSPGVIKELFLFQPELKARLKTDNLELGFKLHVGSDIQTARMADNPFEGVLNQLLHLNDFNVQLSERRRQLNTTDIIPIGSSENGPQIVMTPYAQITPFPEIRFRSIYQFENESVAFGTEGLRFFLNATAATAAMTNLIRTIDSFIEKVIAPNKIKNLLIASDGSGINYHEIGSTGQSKLDTCSSAGIAFIPIDTREERPVKPRYRFQKGQIINKARTDPYSEDHEHQYYFNALSKALILSILPVGSLSHTPLDAEMIGAFSCLMVTNLILKRIRLFNKKKLLQRNRLKEFRIHYISDSRSVIKVFRQNMETIYDSMPQMSTSHSESEKVQHPKRPPKHPKVPKSSRFLRRVFLQEQNRTMHLLKDLNQGNATRTAYFEWHPGHPEKSGVEMEK
jgi:hypothetical protein